MPTPSARRSDKTGLPPGTIVHVGDKPEGPAVLSIITYNEQRFDEQVGVDLDACLASLQTPDMTWINVAGLHDASLIEQLGQALGLHPLVLEDIANASQRPKVEEYDGYLFVVLKMLEYDLEREQMEVEQVSLILGDNYLVSFQEDSSDVFEPVRTRLRNSAGRLRKFAADYLAYALIDAIVDNYFVVLELMGDRIEGIEEQVAEHPEERPLPEIYRLKREMIALRRAVWPLREVLAMLQHSESSLIRSGTVVYLRDVYDHTIQMMDTIESMRDLLSGMMDIYLSGLSNRMNEIVKVLTIFSTIFIPLTFLAGVYGMNFRHFPEIEWRFGYVMFWLICGVTATVMLLYFRRKRWL
jgi:magnesium transporter